MEISTMRNCRGQDLQAAAKTAQNCFYSARLFNPSVSTKDSFLLFLGTHHSVTPAEINPASTSWAVSGSPVTPTLGPQAHSTRVQDLSRAFVTQSVNSGIYYTVFISLFHVMHLSKWAKTDFTRPTLNRSCSSLQPNTLSGGQNKINCKCREDKLPEGYTYFTVVFYCCLHLTLSNFTKAKVKSCSVFLQNIIVRMSKSCILIDINIDIKLSFTCR